MAIVANLLGDWMAASDQDITMWQTNGKLYDEIAPFCGRQADASVEIRAHGDATIDPLVKRRWHALADQMFQTSLHIGLFGRARADVLEAMEGEDLG